MDVCVKAAFKIIIVPSTLIGLSLFLQIFFLNFMNSFIKVRNVAK